MCASSDEPASFLDSLQLRLDPTLSPGVRATLFQDVAKRAPAATRDAVSSACAAAGRGVASRLTFRGISPAAVTTALAP